MKQYNQTRSFNLGIAEDTSVEAAIIYDDLAYAQKVFGEGYFYRSDEMMLKRFPMFSKNTIRRHIKKLVEAHYITTKLKKVDGAPVRHYQIEQILLPKMSKSIDLPKLSKSSINKTTNKTTGPSASDLLSLVNKTTGRAFRTLPARGVKKTLDAFTLEEIERALAALVQDDWHSERIKEFSIDYLIRSTTIDKFLAKAPAATDAKTNNEKALEEVERNNMTVEKHREKYGD